MKVRTLEELQIWQDAREFARVVSEIVQRRSMLRDRRLANQLADSSCSTFSNVSEGFAQGSDRAFVRYLEIARGSNNEALAQLVVARFRNHISEGELTSLREHSTRMGKRMSSLIRYLRKEDRSKRG
jgi:four helix bundle protein